MLRRPTLRLHELALLVCKTYKHADAGQDLAWRTRIDEAPSWPSEQHERLRLQSGAPLSARAIAIEAWRRAHPEWKRLVVEIAHDGVPVATALLGHRVRLGWTEALLLGPQDEPGWIAGLNDTSLPRLGRGVRSALDSLERPWLLRLAHMPLRQTMLQHFLDAFSHVRVAGRCHGVRLKLLPGAPLRSVTTENTRSAVAKARNRILRHGRHLDLAWLSAAPDVERVLPDVLRIHRARNLQLRGMSGLDDPATCTEFTSRVMMHAGEGSVRLLVTRIDGDIAAFALCLLDQRTLHVYANLVAPSWLAYSAGTITNHALVVWAWSGGEIDVIDWGLGVQRYKLSGPITLEPHTSFEIYSSLGVESAVRAARRMRSAMRLWLAHA
jgi:CelD/BcsL family acetyltransferase involved in cellulose biosynthesis